MEEGIGVRLMAARTESHRKMLEVVRLLVLHAARRAALRSSAVS